MKRYMLFSGDYQYPEGGIEDLVCSSDDLQSLKNIIIEHKEKNLHDWFHIYDCKRQEIIFHDWR